MDQLQSTDVLMQRYPFALPALGYALDAVEPAVDSRTMSVHHAGHHATYVANLNRAIESDTALHQLTLRELLTRLPTIPESVRTSVRNDGGGHANHGQFWPLLAPNRAAQPSGALGQAITRDFGSLAGCVTALKQAGTGQFGSGWVWLVSDNGKLRVHTTSNQDTPISERLVPIMGVDVWEHAYYLKYQNKRADYLDAVLARLNWSAADTRYQV
ncbi:MAG: superoxide dismutase [Gemmatimonadaceae bacterium]|nr:superoxide dismutase [Gemmatimonadaceae bacterium]